MTEVVSVRFKNKGKVYYFDPNGLTIAKGDNVVVETAKGLEFAECVSGNHQVEENAVHPPLRPVERLATEEDVRRFEENRRREREAMEICRQRIAKHGLDMKLIDVEYNFEGSKILFFFTSEGRVDFRELVKDLAGIFRTRIELRQIGVRDEARMLGGLGICGRPFCCAQFLDDFQPVSIKMAKTQGLSLNPTKISGSCGRLMCCLKYEQDAYEELVQSVPKTDAFVDTPAGKGTVVDVNLLKGTVRVRLEDQSDMAVKTFEASEVTVLGGKAKRAEYLAALAEGLIEAPRKPQPRLRRAEEPRAQSSGEQKDAPRQEGAGTEGAPRQNQNQRRNNGQRRNQPRQDASRRQSGDRQDQNRRRDGRPQQSREAQGASEQRPQQQPSARRNPRRQGPRGGQEKENRGE